MNYYFIKDIDAKGRHTIHSESCHFQATHAGKIFIGYFSNGKEALAKAQGAHPNMIFKGCLGCCPECHAD